MCVWSQGFPLSWQLATRFAKVRLQYRRECVSANTPQHSGSDFNLFAWLAFAGLHGYTGFSTGFPTECLNRFPDISVDNRFEHSVDDRWLNNPSTIGLNIPSVVTHSVDNWLKNPSTTGSTFRRKTGSLGVASCHIPVDNRLNIPIVHRMFNRLSSTGFSLDFPDFFQICFPDFP